MQLKICIACIPVLFFNVAAEAQVIEPDRAHPQIDIRHPVLPDFSMRERAAIYRAVIAENSLATVPFDTEVTIGTTLPQTEIRSLPEGIRAQIPPATKYKYAVWHHQVLLIDPAKKTVADILHDYILRDQQ